MPERHTHVAQQIKVFARREIVEVECDDILTLTLSATNAIELAWGLIQGAFLADSDAAATASRNNVRATMPTHGDANAN